MTRLYLTPSILMLSLLLIDCAGVPAVQTKRVTSTDPPEKVELIDSLKYTSNISSANCPVTVPQNPPYVPPDPYSPTSPFPGYFWYGTDSLWTLLPTKGVWADLPHDADGYGQKVFWWREGYIWNEEPEPKITVTGERLDAPARTFKTSETTNAYASDIGSAMLTGVTFPVEGCWMVTGKYENAELSFVVWIAP